MKKHLAVILSVLALLISLAALGLTYYWGNQMISDHYYFQYTQAEALKNVEDSWEHTRQEEHKAICAAFGGHEDFKEICSNE